MIILLLFIPVCSLFAQERILVDIDNKTMKICNLKDYIRIYKEKDYTTYEHKYWGSSRNERDTFFYQRTRIIRKKNSVLVLPVLHGNTYRLYHKTIEKPWKDKDSILNAGFQKMYYKNPSSYKSVSHNLTPVKYYNKKYPYVDIYQTYGHKNGKKYRYVSEITRVIMVKEIKYIINVKVRDIERTKSIYSSRRAVCCDFKRLVANLKIIEPQ